MKVQLLGVTNAPEYDLNDLLFTCASQCYKKSFDIQDSKNYTQEQKENIIHKILDSGHTSVSEHINFTFLIEDVSRSCVNQLIRHRIASYSQRSGRYTGLEDGEWCVVPPSIKTQEEINIFKSCINKCKESYERLCELGIKKEDARYLLPNGQFTNIAVTMNCRSLKNFFGERLCCYDKDTEVLTTKGWKHFNDVTTDDLFYSIDPETHNTEYVKSKEIIKDTYTGNMIKIKNNRIDLYVTSNHNLLVCDGNEWLLQRADDTKLPAFMTSITNPIKGHLNHNIKIDKKHQETMYDFMCLLGFLILYGHYSDNMLIIKADEFILNYYTAIINKFISRKKLYDASTIIIDDPKFIEFIKKYFVNGFVADEIYDYDSSILEALYDTLTNLLSDSSYTKEFVNGFQRLCLHLGKSCYYDGQLQIDDNSVTYIDNKEIVPVENLDVYCVELEKNHTLYVRRNGKCVWCGNSRAQWEIRNVANEMAKICKEQFPLIFTDCKFAEPKCVQLGFCTEEQSCGKTKHI